MRTFYVANEMEVVVDDQERSTEPLHFNQRGFHRNLDLNDLSTSTIFSPNSSITTTTHPIHLKPGSIVRADTAAMGIFDFFDAITSSLPFGEPVDAESAPVEPKEDNEEQPQEDVKEESEEKEEEAPEEEAAEEEEEEEEEDPEDPKEKLEEGESHV
jgi:hypothetical protein